MERFQQIKNEEEENYNSFYNVVLIILILLFAYMIERRFPNSFIKNMYFLLAFIIIVIFILKNISKNFSDKFDRTIKKLNKKFPIFPIEENEEEINKKIFKKIKETYELGYTQNKRYSYNTPNNNQNFNSNNFSNYITKDKQFKNDEYLANKISNINKINKSSLMDSFNKEAQYINNNNYEANSNYNINNNYYTNNYINNNNYDENRKTTRFLDFEEKYDKRNSLENKNILSNPFKAEIKRTSSRDNSGNFLLLNSNQNRKQNKFYYLNNSNDLNDTNPINKFIGLDNYQSSNSFLDNQTNYKIPINKEVSYFKYQNLKKQIVNSKALNQNDDNKILKIDGSQIPQELCNIHINSLILKMKNFISKTLIPHIITAHTNNLNNLNNILSSFGLKIISTTTGNESNDYLDILKEKLFLLDSNKIDEIKQDNNLLFENFKNITINNNLNNEITYKNKNDIFPSLNDYSPFSNNLKELNEIKENEKKLKLIFFGDTNKIKNILNLIQNKINSLQNKNIINKNILKSNIIKSINFTNNPFIKDPSTKIYNDYIRNSNETNLSLTNLQKLLYERIIINERIYPKEFFDKKITKIDHILLIMEYAIERFRQLYEAYERNWNGARGGEFLNEGWCSLLPTDSQLISHLIINYLESLYEINYNYNNSNNYNDNFNFKYHQRFLVSYPMDYNIKIDENSSNCKFTTSIFLYQMNPNDTEPIFFIVYKGSLIPCYTDTNTNLYHAFGIYFYLLSIKSPMFAMSLGIHDFIDNIIR